jgi:hypothetical protein
MGRAPKIRKNLTRVEQFPYQTAGPAVLVGSGGLVAVAWKGISNLLADVLEFESSTKTTLLHQSTQASRNSQHAGSGSEGYSAI